jgi:hypothetical protein
MARKYNPLHGVEFVYYRVSWPLSASKILGLRAIFAQYAPVNVLSITVNNASTEAIVKAPYGIQDTGATITYEESPTALFATAPWINYRNVNP